ncbi:hypothetical protein [Dactylosporangium sp. CA-233914]|uniref:hypothetical protein n=1 Tax=Dactylosporangium sp. CA-233914 TaxID=3239934 RepID=UPI003D924AC1
MSRLMVRGLLLAGACGVLITAGPGVLSGWAQAPDRQVTAMGTDESWWHHPTPTKTHTQSPTPTPTKTHTTSPTPTRTHTTSPTATALPVTGGATGGTLTGLVVGGLAVTGLGGVLFGIGRRRRNS